MLCKGLLGFHEVLQGSLQVPLRVPSDVLPPGLDIGTPIWAWALNVSWSLL